MVEKLGHYSMQNVPTIYDEEALTALELVGRTAAKVNEVVDEVNRLPEHVEASIHEMQEDGTLETMLITAISGGKVDKGGKEQITYGMLAQDVKEAMTGGSVAVVGKDGVNTSNLVDGSVTKNKIAQNLRPVFTHIASDFYNVPFLLIDKVNRTATINPEFTDDITVYSVDSYFKLNGENATVDYSTYWTNNGALSIYVHSPTKVIYITNFSEEIEFMASCYLLGKLNNNGGIVNFAVPVEVDGVFYNSENYANIGNLPETVKPVHVGSRDYIGDPSKTFFNIDTVNRSVTITYNGEYNIYNGHSVHTINFSTLSVVWNVPDSNINCYYYYDTVNNALVFINTRTNIPASWAYMGVIYMTNIHASTSVLSFTVDGRYIYNPPANHRPTGHIIYFPEHDSTESVPYVDYANKRLVFPAVRYLYLSDNENFWGIHDLVELDEDKNYIVPLPDSNYNFIVGGREGIKAVNNTEFRKLHASKSADEYLYYGCIVMLPKQAFLSFEVAKGGSLSVLGDSISAFKGSIPEENNYYYDEPWYRSWWGATMRRCGLWKNKINAYSGMRVTNTASAITNGMEFAKALDNGTDPDNIIVYLGTNDFNNEVPLGTYDGRGNIPTDGSTFREAYAIMLNNILATYPKSKVYACTLPAIERNKESVGLPEKNEAGVYLFEYNEAIRELATRFHVEVIDLATCGINHKNGSEFMYDYGDAYTGSFTHPNTKGHKLIAAKVSQTIMYGRN